MGKRTTRQNIVYRARKIPEHIERIMVDLIAIEGLAKGRSPYIEDMLPPLMVLFDECDKTVKRFIDVL